MSKTLLSISAAATCLLLSSSNLYSIGVTFTAESGEVIVGGTPATSATAAELNLTGLAFFVNTAFFDAFTNDAAFGESGSISATQLTDIVTTLNTASGSSYSTLTNNVGAAIDDFDSLFSIFGSQDAGGADFHAIMIIHDSSNLDSLGEGNNIGVVATSSPTLGLGSFTVGFNTTKNWDTTLVGQSGSLTLASVVPEPSTYAALAGLCALGYVIVRRRRA